MTKDRQIYHRPSLLQRLVGGSRIFREESHRGAFRFWHVARFRLRKLATVNSEMRSVHTSAPPVRRSAEKRYGATFLPGNFVP